MIGIQAIADPPAERPFTALERAIVDAIASASARGYRVTSIYLRTGDHAELGRATVDGLPVRLVTGAGSSRVYCQHGVSVAISRRGRP